MQLILNPPFQNVFTSVIHFDREVLYSDEVLGSCHVDDCDLVYFLAVFFCICHRNAVNNNSNDNDDPDLTYNWG